MWDRLKVAGNWARHWRKNFCRDWKWTWITRPQSSTTFSRTSMTKAGIVYGELSSLKLLSLSLSLFRHSFVCIRRHQFEYFMNSVGISFSRKKWQQIFREIDLNNDDMVRRLIIWFDYFVLTCFVMVRYHLKSSSSSCARNTTLLRCIRQQLIGWLIQFTIFVFLIKAWEVRRNKIVKNRATKKTIEYAEALSKLGRWATLTSWCSLSIHRSCRASFTYKPRKR